MLSLQDELLLRNKLQALLAVNSPAYNHVQASIRVVEPKVICMMTQTISTSHFWDFTCEISCVKYGTIDVICVLSSFDHAVFLPDIFSSYLSGARSRAPHW